MVSSTNLLLYILGSVYNIVYTLSKSNYKYVHYTL